ncbi:beta/gamma crystallin domain-containing protein 1 [Parambassis ranga]|uniref:Beta/gamma crystallin domain-containing protein 1 n=1 Tax=Parambassis ranga TaxID=210632 RepID=A0A6P7HQ39_9TELE|nr:beta/gamma crystallin domain-containing protein 1-like [Parambassis ranga]
MAKKSSSRKSLKSLFSRSEASLNESAEKNVDKHEGEKKKFKFLHFKSKSKSGGSSTSEKAAHESQQVLSAVEPSNPADDGEAFAGNKRSSLYATAPRAKHKELSYSEMDLRKPKRFATFSLGLRKKKRKDEENISKSTFGLHTSGIEKNEEAPLDPRPMELEQKKMFSMSQPELDSTNTFDISHPPPMATNKSESPVTLPDQSLSQSQPHSSVAVKTPEPLTNGLQVLEEVRKAPMASIPELELDDPAPSKEKENIPVYDHSSGSDAESTAQVENTCVVKTPILPPSQDPAVPDHKAAVSTRSSLCDNEVLQQSIRNNTESTTLSHHRPDTADSTASHSKASLPGTDTNTSVPESAPAPHSDSADSITIHHDASVSHSERSVPQPDSSVTTTSAASSEKSPRPVNQEAVYGALYESLLPQSFTTGITTLLPHSSPPICTEMRRLDTKTEPVLVKTFSECHTETSVIYSRMSASDRVNHVTPVTETTPIFSTESSRFSSKSETDLTYLPSLKPAVNIPYSELTLSCAQVKPDSSSLIHSTIRSEDSAPPVSHCVTSQGMDAQVTEPKRRVILVKELVTDEASAAAGCTFAEKALEIKIDCFSGPPGQMEGCEGPLSPAYLSVGSDDGSVMEIYYSAEEDNGEESMDEEMFTMAEREEMNVVDAGKEVRLPIELPLERGIRRKDEEDSKVVYEEGNSGSDGNVRDQNEVQPTDQKSEIIVSSDAQSKEKEGATTAWMKDESLEGRKEELLATPVRQVNTLMECDFAPPSSELPGQGEVSEETSTVDLETGDHSNGETQLPSQQGQCAANKDIGSSVWTHASYTREEDRLTPTVTVREAEEQVSLSVEREDSKESSSITSERVLSDTSAAAQVVTGDLSHSTDLQCDATENEHNRATPSSEWADTIVPSGGSALREQVSVELSTSEADARCPDSEAAAEEHPAGVQPHLSQRSLTDSETTTAAPESVQTEDQQESVDKMNSGYSSLSTKLSFKNSSPPQEDESKLRFHKVSLINEADVSQEDTTSTTVSEDVTEYKWKNRFDRVTQYVPNKVESSSFSDDQMSDTCSSNYSFSSTLPEANAYTHLSTASSSCSSSSSAFAEELSDRTEVYLSKESEAVREVRGEWRRSLVEQEEPAAPAGERERQSEAEAERRIKSLWDSQQLPSSEFSSPPRTSRDSTDTLKDDESSQFTGVFKATLVELVSEPEAPPSTPPASPDADSPNQFDMESLVDTLKNMGPSLRPRGPSLRQPPQVLMSSLPPIVEDAPTITTVDGPASLSSPIKTTEGAGTSAEPLNGMYTLPPELGLKRSSARDTRSPLELIRQAQDQLQPGNKGLNLPLRASATNSIVMRKSSDSSSEELLSPVLNGNGVLPLSSTSSRLDSSVLFANYRSSSIDQTLESGKAHRPIFRTGSLPETGLSNDRISTGLIEPGAGTDTTGSRYERFSFLLNTSASSSGSLTGTDDFNNRMSRPPPLSIGSPPSSNSPTRLLSPTGSIDLHRPFTTTDSPLSMFGQTGALGSPLLQRSFSGDGTVGVQNSMFNSVHGGSQFQSQEPEPDRNLVLKYRAFPDAYLTKEKEHGKLNPRPGKMYIFDQPGMRGQRIEIRGDVIDATPWELQETISIRVVRGGWVLYEHPNFKGEKIALDEGDIELTYPFGPSEEQLQNGQKEGDEPNGEQNGETSDEQMETKPVRRFIVGSIRRAVRDYSVPEISLFPEENAEGKKVIFRDTSDDARIFGFPVKANSIIINAGLWLVYAQPFFQGVPRVLEVGGYSNPAAWGVEQPYVGSLHPLKIGEPRVENQSEPKMVIYEKPYFTGKSRTITTNMRDFMTRTDRQQTTFMYSVGSLKVLGGIWVGYEKEGFRGHQYLLEEGEYHDWRVWGGCDSELRSVRVIRADLTDPLMVMFEQLEDDQEGMQDENTFEVTEAIPDVELFGYKTATRSIQVFSGAWIAYSHVDFSGNQYILEKGFYNNCADWGSEDTRICSVQPILLAPADSSRQRNEILLYSEPDFQGECQVFDQNQEAMPEKFLTKSCRVAGGSWVLFEEKQFSGNTYVLSEGDYPNLTSMGCPPSCDLRSVKVVPLSFSVPSISLFSLECLEGREITTDTEILSMVEEGFNNHILSVRVNSGCWVIFEHSNYRGRQLLLEPIEITNWPKFSSLNTIGSMHPVRQKRHCFRVKNKERGHYLSVQGGVEEMKSGRVVVTPQVEPMSDIWFYQDGLIKNKLSPTMNLQVMGNMEPGAKVVLWTGTRQPIQTWTAQMRGLISSLTLPGMVLDVKGGKTYDKDHVVIMPESDERPSQQWEIEML